MMARLIRCPKIGVPESLKHGGNNLPCAVCGVPVVKVRYEVHLVEGGSHLCHPDDEYNNAAADLGWYPVGESCLKQFPELKEFAVIF